MRLGIFIESSFDSRFPLLSAYRVRGHDLLGAELDNFLKPDRHNFWKLLRRINIRTDPRGKILRQPVGLAVEVESADPYVDWPL